MSRRTVKKDCKRIARGEPSIHRLPKAGEQRRAECLTDAEVAVKTDNDLNLLNLSIHNPFFISVLKEKYIGIIERTVKDNPPLVCGSKSIIRSCAEIRSLKRTLGR